MSSRAELHTAYQIFNAPIRAFPYPHCFVQDVFAPDFYAELQRNLPDPEVMIPILEARQIKGYDERFVLELHKPEHLATLPDDKRQFWQDAAKWLVGGSSGQLGLLGQLMMQKFQPFVLNRFKGNLNGVKFYDEAYLVEDITNYKIGPHTDSSVKVITLLFYLPKDESQLHLGTSIYLPKDRNFRCDGGPHYPFEWFERMATMPFRPNSLFTFVKGDTSFHGVEPVRDADCKRWLLLFDVFMEQAEVQSRHQPGWQASVQLAPASAMAAPSPAQAPAPQGAKFTF
jgi:hypothetical protein